MERKHTIPLLVDDWRPGPELDMQIMKATEAVKEVKDMKAIAPAPDIITYPAHISPECNWTYFTFSASSLATLKDTAKNSLPKDTPYVTTDDALSVFLFQSILRARSVRLDRSSTV